MSRKDIGDERFMLLTGTKPAGGDTRAVGARCLSAGTDVLAALVERYTTAVTSAQAAILEVQRARTVIDLQCVNPPVTEARRVAFSRVFDHYQYAQTDGDPDVPRSRIASTRSAI